MGWAGALVLGGPLLLMLGLAVVEPERFGILLLLGALGLVAVALGLASPLLATFYLFITTFFRLAIPESLFPVQPLILAFLGVVLSVGLWLRRQGDRRPGIGLLEAAVGLYLAWNLGSIVAPHTYGAIYPQDGGTLPVTRFVLIGVAMPLISLILGTLAFGRERAVRVLLYSVMVFAAYSAFVSLMQFFGPPALVWPSYIVNAPGWEDRAVGVFNQPVVNGMVMVLGYLAAVLVASQAGEPRVLRGMATGVGVACCLGIYLTHTRAAWLCFVLVVVLGIIMAKGWRLGFVLTFAVMMMGVVANWASLVSDDRSSGGVGSASEIHDRLNMIATSLWAIGEKPLAGWGIGRFPAVNTYHHQQWSPSIPWERGYGLASHFDVLSIAVELGLVGLALWLLAMTVVINRLIGATRALPAGGMCDQRFALLAVLSLVTMLVTGLTVDLRFFDFPNIVVMLLVGAAIARADDARRRAGEVVAR